MNPLTLRPYTQNDLPALCAIWNEVVAAGDAFPQEDCLTPETGAAFFAGQSYCGVACDEAGQLLGLYILHPNNVGRCGHLCNASYAVSASDRGRGVGRQLVRDCIDQAARLGFRILQFNAVVATNTPARRLYESLGFQQLRRHPRRLPFVRRKLRGYLPLLSPPALQPVEQNASPPGTFPPPTAASPGPGMHFIEDRTQPRKRLRFSPPKQRHAGSDPRLRLSAPFLTRITAMSQQQARRHLRLRACVFHTVRFTLRSAPGSAWL